MSTNQRIVFVNNLCHYMQMCGVDQSDIVSALGISASTVSDWVNGKKYPRVDAMQKIADYLGVLLSDLTTEHSDDDKSGPLTPSESELITIFRDLNDKGQDALLRQARYLASDPDMKRGSASNTATA